jgi:hypothetical protein
MTKSRRVAKQSPVRGTYYVYSDYTDQVAALESEIEVDYFNLLNFERTASTFIAQPGSEYYQTPGGKRCYSPDFRVVRDGVTYVVEIKDIREIRRNNKLADKFRILKKYFSQRGQVFVVLTDVDIRIGERHHNLNYLNPVLRHPPPIPEMEELRKALPQLSTSHIFELQDRLRDLGLNPGLCRRAIAHKLMHCDLTQPWDSLQLSW